MKIFITLLYYETVLFFFIYAASHWYLPCGLFRHYDGEILAGLIQPSFLSPAFLPQQSWQYYAYYCYYIQLLWSSNNLWKPHFVFEEVHAGYNQKISEHTEVVTNLLFVSVCFTLVVT